MWTALCAETKIVPCWLVGGRSMFWAKAFMQDLQSRLASRVQLTADAHKPYLEAAEGSFGDEIDHA